ncbi:MAG: hypothetical protein ACOYJX_00480 [Acutalibacteraceae bacterium]|jgi:hypothetical protein
MKPKNALIFLVLLAIVIFEQTYKYVNIYGLFNENYNTVLQATNEDKAFKGKEVLEVIKDKGIAFVFCKHKNQIELEYLYCGPKGWRVFTEKFEHSKKNKHTKNYWLDYIEFNGKNIFVFSNSISSLKDKSEPTDSLNSHIARFDLQFEGNDEVRFTYWMWVLDEVPEDYSINFSGENIPVK